MANLNVTYEEMTEAAGRLDTGRDQMTTTLTDLRRLIDQLVADGFQTQMASGAFHETYQKFTTGTTQAIEGLQGLSQFLRSAAEAMQKTDEELAKAIRQD
ncbi:WXG100 family type VII secretion target [Herbiconiux sp. KACC 21604]|uniref:WXG100 family type VII secretion target n=1 Tax=unclassified Herbiconiux TaxID=2618217 RepID=UPI001491F87F|nr:WXG100 family type VII secretion target [Herbiconiux sp. SALV-R1]QJU54263.1 WXG100 family type VII secretion target [Herbiconiux sp. SALV-R1]WPO85330.1 WXG100 family type VII secretion target [Herbiconiux sp. KACC 21604]